MAIGQVYSFSCMSNTFMGVATWVCVSSPSPSLHRFLELPFSPFSLCLSSLSLPFSPPSLLPPLHPHPSCFLWPYFKNSSAEWCPACHNKVKSQRSHEQSFSFGAHSLKNNIPNEPHHEKTCLWDFRSGKTQTGLRSHRSWVGA